MKELRSRHVRTIPPSRAAMSSMRVDLAVHSPVKPRPSWLKALGKESPPPSIEIDGQTFHLVELFKHDSWAATMFVRGPGRSCSHRQDAPTIVSWRSSDGMAGSAGGAPRAEAARNPGGLAGHSGTGRKRHDSRPSRPWRGRREFIAGHPLGDREAVSDTFFHELEMLIHSMHSRRVIYVDLHKRENIVVAPAGKPYLIDFQISLYWPRWLPRWPLFELMRRSDEYHLMKHWSRCRPDQLGVGLPGGPAAAAVVDSSASVDRAADSRARRRLLVAVGVRSGKGRVESELFAEHALRADGPQEPRAASINFETEPHRKDA